MLMIRRCRGERGRFLGAMRLKKKERRKYIDPTCMPYNTCKERGRTAPAASIKRKGNSFALLPEKTNHFFFGFIQTPAPPGPKREPRISSPERKGRVVRKGQGGGGDNKNLLASLRTIPTQEEKRGPPRPPRPK